MTALYAASCNGHLDVVRYLREAGADESIADNSGITPAQAASANGHTHVGRYLRNPLSSSTAQSRRQGGGPEVTHLKSEICELKQELRGLQTWYYMSLSLIVLIIAILIGGGYIRMFA